MLKSIMYAKRCQSVDLLLVSENIPFRAEQMTKWIKTKKEEFVIQKQINKLEKIYKELK